jgi:hypothetical protein
LGELSFGISDGCGGVFHWYGLTEEKIMTVFIDLLSMPSVSESKQRRIQAYDKEYEHKKQFMVEEIITPFPLLTHD